MIKTLAKSIWKHLDITGYAMLAIYGIIGYFTLSFEQFQWVGITLVMILITLKGIKGRSK